MFMMEMRSARFLLFYFSSFVPSCGDDAMMRNKEKERAGTCNFGGKYIMHIEKS